METIYIKNVSFVFVLKNIEKQVNTLNYKYLIFRFLKNQWTKYNINFLHKFLVCYLGAIIDFAFPEFVVVSR